MGVRSQPRKGLPRPQAFLPFVGWRVGRRLKSGADGALHTTHTYHAQPQRSVGGVTADPGDYRVGVHVPVSQREAKLYQVDVGGLDGDAIASQGDEHGQHVHPFVAVHERMVVYQAERQAGGLIRGRTHSDGSLWLSRAGRLRRKLPTAYSPAYDEGNVATMANKQPYVRVVRQLDVSKFPWCQEAVLIDVADGLGALRRQSLGTGRLGGLSQAVLLNGVPLLRKENDTCPTCEAMLATGYGIERADSHQFREVADRINSPYCGFQDAIDRIGPVLGLLDDGLHVVAAADLYPSDGNGHFFWNVPNDFTYQPGTVSACVAVDDQWGVASGVPAFLYPSQSTDRFDAARVEHYRAVWDDALQGYPPAQCVVPPHQGAEPRTGAPASTFPRAIAYAVGELIAVLLDGHHKAGACALGGRSVPALVIMSPTWLVYPGDAWRDGVLDKRVRPASVVFEGLSVDTSGLAPEQLDRVAAQVYGLPPTPVVACQTELVRRVWPRAYAESWRRFPSVDSFATAVVAGGLDVGRVDEWLQDPVPNAVRLGAAIQLLSATDPERVRAVALQAARLRVDRTLTLIAFQALDPFHDDEVEQLFIDELVANDYRHDPIRQVADHHWDNWDQNVR